MMQRAEITVLIADDHPIFRSGLRTVISAAKDLRIVGEAGDGAAALDLIESMKPDVAILDIDMPLADGVAVARAARAKGLPTKIVFLTMHKDEELLEAVRDLKINGYVLKDSAITEIVDCIKAVAVNRKFLSPALADLVLAQSESSFERKAKSALAELTPTERRVLRFVAESKTNREIADELFVSQRTIENHRANISSKLNLRGFHALLTFALEHKDEL